MGAPPKLSGGTTEALDYQLEDDGFYDEAFEASGVCEPRTGGCSAPGGAGPGELATSCPAEVEQLGVSFGSGDSAEAFHVDPVPRVLDAAEWEPVEAASGSGCGRCRVHRRRVRRPRHRRPRAWSPSAPIETCQYFEPWMIGVDVPAWTTRPWRAWTSCAGPTGCWRCWRTTCARPRASPTPARRAQRWTPRCRARRRPSGAPSAPATSAGRGAPRGRAPEGDGDPYVVLLSDGPGNSAWYEHRELAPPPWHPARDARRPLPEPWPRCVRMVDGRSREVDVVYRRTDEDRLQDDHGRPTWVAEVLLEPCRAGRLACVNAFGSGVADDKLVHAYVEAMVRFYLGEEPLIRSVPTYDLAIPAVRDERPCAHRRDGGEAAGGPRRATGSWSWPHARPRIASARAEHGRARIRRTG